MMDVGFLRTNFRALPLLFGVLSGYFSHLGYFRVPKRVLNTKKLRTFPINPKKK